MANWFDENAPPDVIYDSGDPNDPSNPAYNNTGVVGPGVAPGTTQVGTVERGRRYQPILGWDTGKLNDPGRTGGQTGKADAKYDFMRWVQNTGTTPQQFRGHPELAANDPTLRRLYPNMQAIGKDKIDFGDGHGPIDVSKAGGNQWIWVKSGSGGGGGDRVKPGDPDYDPSLDPHGDGYPRKRQPGGGGGAPGGGAPGGGVGTGELVAPWTDKFAYDPYKVPEWQGEFHPPTAEEAMADPGTQFALAEGQKGIERSAAAGGTLFTGGTLKDLSKYRMGVASQAYGDIYGRRQAEYQQKYGEFGQGAERGSQGWNTNYGKARSEFDLARNIWESNQDRSFDKFYKLADLGRY